MILLVSGSTRSVREQAPTSCGNLGHLLTPLGGNRIETILETGLPWAADNGAFKGFDSNRFMTLLNNIVGKPRCLFVVAPDVVANASETARCLYQWWPRLRRAGHPIAFVLQDGQEDRPLPEKKFWDVAFIGGTTDFKLSRAAADIVHDVKAMGRWVHMGRVNSKRRIKYAMRIGCDSFDGTSTSMFGDVWIPKHLRSIQSVGDQPLIDFEGNP